MLSGLLLFFVGIVLILNGLWMLQLVSDREVGFINLFVGLLGLRVAHEQAFGPGASEGGVRDAALTLLFAATYLWNAFNRALNNDGRGLGWFSLLVALTAAFQSLRLLAAAEQAMAWWSALSWAAWAVLWLLFYMLLVYRKPWHKLTGWISMAQGVLTGCVPGFMLLA